jgi:hypothetical protein
VIIQSLSIKLEDIQGKGNPLRLTMYARNSVASSSLNRAPLTSIYDRKDTLVFMSYPQRDVCRLMPKLSERYIKEVIML